jgi:serine/threonine protein phosphatase PrpC
VAPDGTAPRPTDPPFAGDPGVGEMAGAVDPEGTTQPESAAEETDAAEPAGGERRHEGAGRAAAPGPSVSFAFNLAKIEGHGEDSDPILREGRELGLVAVFDGMGGAGGTVYETPDGPRTGAYLASRLARDAVQDRMLDLLDPEWNLDGPAAAREVEDAVRRVLVEHLEELNAPPSGLRSRLLRALPTTMALIALQRRTHDGDLWACHLLWSGDSRAYVFEPVSGAHQLTVDDIRDGGDAMRNLREDSVVSNAMSADTDFVVHHRQVQLTSPFVAVAATDGCFGYLPTPMHFEHLVLQTLKDSTDGPEWSGALQAAISEVTGDDASMSVLGVGADHAGFKELFAERTDHLQRRCVRPLDELDIDVMQARRRLEELRERQQQQQAQLWAEYKPAYEQYLVSARDVSV